MRIRLISSVSVTMPKHGGRLFGTIARATPLPGQMTDNCCSFERACFTDWPLRDRHEHHHAWAIAMPKEATTVNSAHIKMTTLSQG